MKNQRFWKTFLEQVVLPNIIPIAIGAWSAFMHKPWQDVLLYAFAAWGIIAAVYIYPKMMNFKGKMKAYYFISLVVSAGFLSIVYASTHIGVDSTLAKIHDEHPELGDAKADALNLSGERIYQA